MQPAEDERDQEEDRQLEREGGGPDVLVDVHEQGATESREGGAQHERAHLVAIPVHAGALRGDRIALEREKRSSPVAPHHVARREQRQHHRGIREVEEVIALEVEPERQAQRRDVLNAERALRQPDRLVDERLENQPEGDRRDGQIRALEPQRGNAEPRASQGCEHDGDRQGDPVAHAQPGHQDRGRVRADREQPGVPHAHVAVVTDHEIEPGDDDGVHTRLHEHRVHEILVARRERNEQRKQQERPAEPSQEVHARPFAPSACRTTRTASRAGSGSAARSPACP